MIKHRDSHIDHGLSEAQLRYLLDRFADRESFFIETLTLTRELGTVPCGLYGPIMGDSVIREDEVTYAPRGSRAWPSRLIDLPARQQHEVTVIAGPHEEKCSKCDGIGTWYGLSIPPDNGPWPCRDLRECRQTQARLHPLHRVRRSRRTAGTWRSRLQRSRGERRVLARTRAREVVSKRRCRRR